MWATIQVSIDRRWVMVHSPHASFYWIAALPDFSRRSQGDFTKTLEISRELADAKASPFSERRELVDEWNKGGQMAEDPRAIHDENAAANVAALRRIPLILLRRDESFRQGKKVKGGLGPGAAP